MVLSGGIRVHKSKKDITLFYIYIYAFFVIYMPEFGGFIGLRSHMLLIIILLIMLIPYLMNKPKHITVINKDLFYLCLGIFLSSVYFAIRAGLSGNDIRLLQNNFIIVQIAHVSIIITILKNKGFNYESMMRFILNLGLIQGIICIVMVLVPSTREIALNLYYNGREENIFITSSRIYGISGDYTFFTPVFHGILAMIACVFAVLKNYKYLLYLPFVLISILLNGRIGLMVFALGVAVAFLTLLLRGKSIFKVLNYIVVFISIAIISIVLIKYTVPGTYEWLKSGLQDSLKLITEKELSGNYSTLLDSMLYWPQGFSLIWGEGYRVYGEGGALNGHSSSSDIGYVNDMFMGGIIYISILYTTILRFVLKTKNSNVNLQMLINKIVSISLIFILLLSNYKGESMRSGTILLAIVFIKLVLNNEKNELG